jgi:hypothetical protein
MLLKSLALHHVQIYYKSNGADYFCSGMMVHPRYVLSSYDCMNKFEQFSKNIGII